MGKGRGKSGKASLKNALQSQKSRFKEKEKLSHAAQIAEQKTQKGGKKQIPTFKLDKGKGRAIPLRPTIPFQPTDKILLIGEGNFSFARALIFEPPVVLRAFPPSNLTATAYDSEEGCYAKYSDAREIVAKLKDRGVNVLFGTDATNLEKISALRNRKWDKIVWNFPHAGKGITDEDRNILSNQTLILAFLRSVSHVLSTGAIPSFQGPGKKKKKGGDNSGDEGTEIENEDASFAFIPQQEMVKTRGTVLITLRNVSPYTLWDVPRLAKKPPLPTGSMPKYPKYIQLRSFRFDRNTYNGYSHRMTKGERAHGTGKTGEGGEDRTWEFCLADGDRV